MAFRTIHSPIPSLDWDDLTRKGKKKVLELYKKELQEKPHRNEESKDLHEKELKEIEDFLVGNRKKISMGLEMSIVWFSKTGRHFGLNS